MKEERKEGRKAPIGEVEPPVACTPGCDMLRDSCLLVCLWAPFEPLPHKYAHSLFTAIPPSMYPAKHTSQQVLAAPSLCLWKPPLPHSQHQPCSQALTLHRSCSALSGGGRTQGREGIAGGGGKRCPLPPPPSFSQGSGEPGEPSAAFQLNKWGPRT